MPNLSYVGRFAPSPSGLLHLGSLYTALASYLIAKSQQGQWLVRIEDIDPPREATGASQGIIESLAAHALISDAPVEFQSNHSAAYQNAIQTLNTLQLTYHCTCNRKRLSKFKGLYDRHCLNQDLIKPSASKQPAFSIRFKAPDTLPTFIDQLQGSQSNPANQAGLHHDFIIKRKDGFWAYQLALVVDDIAAGITDVVRGIDLLSNTPMQLALYQALNAPKPSYLHLPVLCTESGKKLSKQNHAAAINSQKSVPNLIHCLTLLGQHLPVDAHNLTPEQLIDYAVKHFQVKKIPACQELMI